MKLFKKKSVVINNTDDEVVLEKAKTLVGVVTNIWGVCGDVENVTLTGVIGIVDYHGHKEVGFTTDNSFYKTVYYYPETIMKWKRKRA